MATPCPLHSYRQQLLRFTSFLSDHRVIITETIQHRKNDPKTMGRPFVRVKCKLCKIYQGQCHRLNKFAGRVPLQHNMMTSVFENSSGIFSTVVTLINHRRHATTLYACYESLICPALRLHLRIP